MTVQFKTDLDYWRSPDRPGLSMQLESVWAL